MAGIEPKPLLPPLPGDLEVTKAYLDREIANTLRVTIRSADIVMPLDGVTIQTLKPSPVMTFMPSGIRIDIETGEVTIPDGLSLTEAAKAFWAAVQHVAGYRAPGFW